MTEKDKELIRRARQLHYFDWEIAYNLAEEADTEEARDILNHIGSLLYHIDEAHADMV